MNILGSLSLPDAEIFRWLENHFLQNHTALIPDFILERMVRHFRAYRKDGMSLGWILNEMKKKRVEITAGAYIPTDAQLSVFVSGMGRIEKGDLPPDPRESPSWGESFDMGLGKLPEIIPWGKILLAAAAAAILYGVTTTATRTLLTR